MNDAKRDNNSVPTLIGVLNTNGETPKRIYVNTSNSNSLITEDSSSGSDNGPVNAKRDANQIPVAMVASSAGDGAPVALYVDSSNRLLIDSN